MNTELVINTEPTDDFGHPFAPPVSWVGTRNDYIAMMRLRYKTQPYGQHIALLKRRCLGNRQVSYTGPWADEARYIIEMLCTERRTAAA